ncbi:MAG: hypothetical protein ACT4PE_00250 [Candidatus Eiseniibacteriota bacterium]
MTRDDDARLDALLQGLPPGPSVSFTDDVMRRVRVAPRPAAAPAPAWAEPALPWWTRALLQPATIGAFVIAALFAVWSDELLRGSLQLSGALASGITAAAAEMPSWSGLLLAINGGSLLLALLAVQGARIFLNSPVGHRAQR